VQFAFFAAYGIGSLIYYIISMVSATRSTALAYKNGVIIGLLIAATGSALFYPAAGAASYPFFLVALFVVGLGFAMCRLRQILMSRFWSRRNGVQRLNLSQAFNLLARPSVPSLADGLIFTFFTSKDAHGADSVKIPYLCFAGVFSCCWQCSSFMQLPKLQKHRALHQGAGATKASPHGVGDARPFSCMWVGK